MVSGGCSQGHGVLSWLSKIKASKLILDAREHKLTSHDFPVGGGQCNPYGVLCCMLFDVHEYLGWNNANFTIISFLCYIMFEILKTLP